MKRLDFKNARITKRKQIPYDFVVDRLTSLEPVVRAMFGCHAIYVGEKIVLILREKPDYRDDNGVWIATTPEHHESLQKDFPSMRSIKLFGSPVTAWQNLPAEAEADDFESSVERVCELILRRDPRVGKIPERKKRSSKPPRKK